MCEPTAVSCDHDDDEPHGEAQAVARPSWLRNEQVLASAAAWIFVAVGLVLQWRDVGLPAIVCFAVSIALAGWHFGKEAVTELVRERAVGIELLMTLAIVGAAGIGQWREAALVAALFSISEALEHLTIQRTRHAIRRLMDLVPPRARVLRDGEEVEVDVQDVAIGDRIQVRPGESIPVDGIILSGATAIDESAVTGESMPVDKGEGQRVFAGTLNGNGAFVVEARKTFADNTVSAIIELVEKAQRQKGRSQLWVERFGRIYSPAVLGASVLLAVVPGVWGADGASALFLAVSFLVAASPCALAVATPVTLVAAIGSAARRGVLLKGGVVLEGLAKLRVVALDKTGTVTTGKPSVSEILPVGEDPSRVLQLAASVEHLSEHPLATAIVADANKRRLELAAVAQFRALTAAGVEGVVEGSKIAVLKPAAAVQRGVTLDEAAIKWGAEREERGNSVVIVVRDGVAIGSIALADSVRPQARELVSALRRVGVDRVVMLTGDNEGTARHVAAQVGIDEYFAGLLPAQKVEKVEELSRRYGAVAMVGDGINDAPALAAASVGIAMGVAGSDAALAAADVALMADDLGKLEYAVALGRRSARIIKQNLAAALVIVVALVAGVFLGELSMFAAVVGHEGSEVLIILNGLRAALGR